MAQGNFVPCFKFTVGEEGDYSDKRRDHGNWSSGQVGVGRFVGSRWGISAPTLIDWLGTARAHEVTADYMRNLPLNTARDIYHRHYWIPIWGDQLPAGIDLAVWDFGVNAGVSRSVEELQREMAVEVDGIMGKNTLKRIGDFYYPDLIKTLIDWHDWFYRQCADFAEDGTGWLNRQRELRTTALAMAQS